MLNNGIGCVEWIKFRKDLGVNSVTVKQWGAKACLHSSVTFKGY